MLSIRKSLMPLALIIPVLFSCQKDPETVLTQNPPTVDAGNNQVIQMPASSFTLSGNASSQNGSIRAYLWSLVSGPNVPVITSPGSKTTTVTGFVSGNYLFQLMATDSAGLTGVDTTRVQVNPSPVQTLSLQPANNTNEVVIHLLDGNSGTNPILTELVAGAWTSGGSPFNIRSAFKFDLSSIPTSATILTANLLLFSNPTPLNGDHINANSGSNNAMYVRRFVSNWAPSTITWFNQPQTSLSDQVLIPHTSSSFLDLSIDVRALITNMLLQGNNGFLIGLQSETYYNIRNFCSSKYPDISKHPKLVITYQ